MCLSVLKIFQIRRKIVQSEKKNQKRFLVIQSCVLLATVATTPVSFGSLLFTSSLLGSGSILILLDNMHLGSLFTTKLGPGYGHTSPVRIIIHELASVELHFQLYYWNKKTDRKKSFHSMHCGRSRFFFVVNKRMNVAK